MDMNNSQDLRFSVPFNKIDKENRIVSGWASLDNVDQQGDIVTSKCSSDAFATFKGNLRLMHQPIAIGKVVDFKEDTYFDTDTQKAYHGVWVSAYISKGAEDAWQMVLDGTLCGFSIGGKIDPDSVETIFEKGQAIRVVNKMVLYELSLVDSPANQLCSIMAIQKSVDGDITATGIATGITVEDVFYCKKDEILASGKDEKDCIKCNEKMTSIGWLERTDSKNAPIEMQKMLSEYIEKAKDSKKPYGDVVYADSGFQEDGKKRYPIDTEDHVRAAWSYINQGDNAGAYSPEHLKTIRAKIKSAAKKFGIEISDESSKSIDGQQIEKEGETMSENEVEKVLDSSEATEEAASEQLETADAEKALDGKENNGAATNPSVNTQYDVPDDMDDDDLPKGALVAVQPQDDFTESEVAVAQHASEAAVDGMGQSSTGAPAVPQGVADPMASTQPLSQDTQPVVTHVINDDLKAVIVQTVKDALASMVSSQEKMLSKAIADAQQETNEKLDGLEKKLSEATAEAVEEVSKSLEGRVEEVEGATAIKKSGELGGPAGAVKKSMWNGAFSVPRHFFDSDSIINQEGR